MSESDSISGEIITYQYDASNHLTGSTKTVSGITQYTQSNTYDYRGKRISKTDDGATTSYFYQNDTLLYTKDGSGNKTSQNIIGPEGNIIATVHFDNGEHAFFYNKDIRTSVISVVDESGSCAASYKYDDFGTISKPQNQNFYNEICYTSGVYDELTGKYYLNARYYSPATAMFLTQDSYRGEKGDYATWNMYAYCAGNPITYTDPSGHFAATATFVTYFTFDAVVSLALYCMCVDAVNKTYEVRNSYDVVLDRNLNEYALSQKYNIDKNDKKVVKKKKLTLSGYSSKKIGRRGKYNTRKKAYQNAKRAGKNKEPIHHFNGGKNPHYHPNVKNNYSKTPHQYSKHDHFYYSN